MFIFGRYFEGMLLFERWYAVLNGRKHYTDTKYVVSAGKYRLFIKGYVRKGKAEVSGLNCGFYFSLTESETVNDFKKPREQSDYDFNAGNMRDK